MKFRRTVTAVAGAALTAGALVAVAEQPSAVPAARAAAAAPTGLRSVMWVGNNWAGTASIVDANRRQVLRRGVDLIPDKEQELADIATRPDRLVFYLAIQQGPGEGHDQYVDDMFTTPNGRFLAVSRPSFGDVVWFDVAKATAGRTDSIVREQQMDGYRTDHMGLSPNGKRLLVSDSTERQVIEYAMVDQTLPNGRRVRMGDRLRRFASGETPHESNYTRDGKRVFHASIGKVYTPTDQPAFDTTKGDRWFQIVGTSGLRVNRRWNMGRELAERGRPGMSPAVRPMALAPKARFVYYQVSFFHGLVEFDTAARDANRRVDYTSGGKPEPRTGRVKRVLTLPNRVPTMPKEQYVNDSAHHGLSMNRYGRKLCVAGTMDDYAAIVRRSDFSYRILDRKTTGHDYGKPYWTTEGPRNTCWISLSESDAVAVVDFATSRELAYLPVGDHPQRVRHGHVPEAVIASW